MQGGELAAGAVILFGVLAGSGELVSRYRDAPRNAILSFPGGFYLALNAGVSLLAFVCLRSFNNPIRVDNDPSSFATYFLQATAAGFGAIGLLRTSFFNVRIGDKDVGLGPGLVLQVILDATDREVDRRRAQKRSALVRKAMQRVSFAKARISLPAYCIALMQNLSAGDQQKLGTDVENLARQAIDDDTLALILGLNLTTYVSSDVLQQAVEALAARITGLPPPQIKGIEPASASGTASPVPLTITGDAFQQGAVVWINSILCQSPVVTSPSTVTCTTPAGPQKSGFASVVIANPDGQSASSLDKFSYT